MNKRFCLALDLKNDPVLIQAYEEHHKNIWPEIKERIKASGILNMEIFRWENRLFMIMETKEEFSFQKKQQMDEADQKVKEWENLMSTYQQNLPGTDSNQKWQLMTKIFGLQ